MARHKTRYRAKPAANKVSAVDKKALDDERRKNLAEYVDDLKALQKDLQREARKRPN